MSSVETRKVNLADYKVERQEFKVIPQGKYEFELGEVTVKVPKTSFRADGSVKTPYISLDLRLFGGTLPPEGRRLGLGANLYLGMRTDDKGKQMFVKENGLLALLESIGASTPELTTTEYTAVAEDGTEKSEEMLNSQEVVECLQAHRGARGQCYLKVRANTYNGKTENQNEVSRFFPKQDA